MDDDKPLTEYGFNGSIAKTQAQAKVRLGFRATDFGKFETSELTSASSPPELPDVLKPPESQAHDQIVG